MTENKPLFEGGELIQIRVWFDPAEAEWRWTVDKRGYTTNGFGISREDARERQMNKARKEYKRWILGAWDKHRVWMDEQGRVLGKDYVLPNEVERLLK
jgi:hypothetical protein